jgi:hypothetical protein
MIALATIGNVLWRVATITIPVPLAIVGAAALWWQIDKSSAVRVAVKDALVDFVAAEEIAARDATNAELARQIEAGRVAHDMLIERITELKVANAAADERREQDIQDYEAKLAAEGRRCNLSDADIEWLQHNP